MPNDPARWARLAARAADDKLGLDTVVIDVGDVFSVTDHFVITSGANSRQVHAIVDEVEERVHREGGPKPRRIEGRETREWVLMDYGDFIVHVFEQETRAYYELERLWNDRPRLDWKVA